MQQQPPPAPAAQPGSGLARIGHAAASAAALAAAAMLAAIFVAFIAQIAMRYLFNWPVGWTSELSVIAWLWLVLWGSAFVVRDDEEIRVDLLTSAVARRPRLVLEAIGSVAMIVLLAMSLPASYDYVSFMKVEKTSYLKIPFNWLYSIYLLFAAALIGRHLLNLWRIVRGHDRAPPDPVRSNPSL